MPEPTLLQAAAAWIDSDETIRAGAAFLYVLTKNI
jgi:hypothetical protein